MSHLDLILPMISSGMVSCCMSFSASRLNLVIRSISESMVAMNSRARDTYSAGTTTASEGGAVQKEGGGHGERDTDRKTKIEREK